VSIHIYTQRNIQISRQGTGGEGVRYVVACTWFIYMYMCMFWDMCIEICVQKYTNVHLNIYTYTCILTSTH